MNDADNNTRPRQFAPQASDDRGINQAPTQPSVPQHMPAQGNSRIGNTGLNNTGLGESALKELEELERQLRALSAFQTKTTANTPASNASPRLNTVAANNTATDPSARQSALRALLESRGVSVAQQSSATQASNTQETVQTDKGENVKKALLSVWEQAEANVKAAQHDREQQQYINPRSVKDHATQAPSSTQQPYQYDHEANSSLVMRGSLSDNLDHDQNEAEAEVVVVSRNTAADTPESDVSLFEARLRENMQALQDRDLALQEQLAVQEQLALQEQNVALQTQKIDQEQYHASNIVKTISPVVERIAPQTGSGFSLKPLSAPSQFSGAAQPSSVLMHTSHVEGLNSDIPVPQPPVVPKPSLLRGQNHQPEASQLAQTAPSKHTSAHSAGLNVGGVQAGERKAPQIKRSEPVRSRRRLLMIAASVVASIIGLASFNAWRGLSPDTKTGDAPLIKADQNPTRIQPQNPGGLDIPNQNKQIYEKPSVNSNGSQARIVDNEEQPVDLQQAVRSQSNTSTEAQSPLGEPRKVRTIAIRPDGAAQTDQVVVPPPPAAKVMPPVKTVVNKPVEQKQQSVSTRTVEPPQRPIQNTIEQAIAEIPPSPEPTVITPIATRLSPEKSIPDGQKIQQRLSAVNTAPAPVPDVAAGERNLSDRGVKTASLPATSNGSGDFGVQLAAPGSEKEAQTVFSELQKRHAALSGYSPVVKQATVGERTIYRLRVGALSRDEATSLCTRLKANGGQCFVTKN